MIFATLCLANTFLQASVSAPQPIFDIVFGVQIGKSNPSELVKLFGKSVGEVRHYWSEREKFFIRDDGWDWWHWPEANADIQSYWRPAYPKSQRRIVSITICESFVGKSSNKSIIQPNKQVTGWLAGLSIGMAKSDAEKKLTQLFGPPIHEFGNFVWRSMETELFAGFEKGRLYEILISRRDK